MVFSSRVKSFHLRRRSLFLRDTGCEKGGNSNVFSGEVNTYPTEELLGGERKQHKIALGSTWNWPDFLGCSLVLRVAHSICLQAAGESRASVAAWSLCNIPHVSSLQGGFSGRSCLGVISVPVSNPSQWGTFWFPSLGFVCIHILVCDWLPVWGE